MRRVYVRERSAYTVEEFAKKFIMDSERASGCISALSSRGVLVLRFDRQSDTYDPDENDNVRGKYQFVWVGLAIFEDVIAIVYPKYFPEEPCDEDGKPSESIKQIFQVLRKYGSGYSHINSLAHEGKAGMDSLSLMLGLIESYGEHGAYTNYVKVLRDNGVGEIDWERTISSFQPFISDGSPVYFDYETIETSRDTADYVTRLHCCVLTHCSGFLHDNGLDELLALDPIEISDEDIDDFGGIDLINYRLDQERSVQFITWKQNVIDMLRLYIGKGETPLRPDETVCLGTTSFYHAWEDACKVAFNDALDRRIGDLGLELKGAWPTRRDKTVFGIIPRPVWVCYSDGEKEPCGEVDTLKPDIICLKKRANGDSVFCIFDAKYYTPKMGKRISGVPGVESITKQILYQSAYKDFVCNHRFSHVANAFIVPTDNDTIAHVGDVSFPGVFEKMEDPLSDDIQMWEMPARLMFDAYLSSVPISDDILDPLWEPDSRD